jgi:Phosphotransferase enzyme family
VAGSATLHPRSGQTGGVEERLAGGVANAGRVTRDGTSVFRPSNPHSRSIHALLTAVRGAGFDGASAPVGIEDDGREQLLFIEGEVPLPPYPSWSQTDAALASLAGLLLEFHRASRAFSPEGSSWSQEMADPDGGSIVCHNDVCLENVVFRDGVAVGLLDFDFAAPGRPVYDLAQMARMCVPVDDDVSAARLGWEVPDRPARLRLVADAYGLGREERGQLLGIVAQSMERGSEFVRRRVEQGDPNFVRMLVEMGGMERYERRRRWWEGEERTFIAALD